MNMEALSVTISIVLLLGLITVPILLFVGIKKWYRLKFDFIAYLISGLILTGGIMWIIGWWADYSDQLLMTHYGYDFDAMNETDRFNKVETENLEKVKQLEIGYLGIGWPLQAIIAFIVYSPYLLIVYLVGHFIAKARGKNREHVPDMT